MFVQVRKLTIAEGHFQTIVEQFSQPGIIEQQEGFIDLKVMVKKVRRGEEEVMVLVHWQSEEAWKNWEKSDAHIAGHKAKKEQSKPDYILDVEVDKYEVKAVKTAIS
ncbi:antibiotic biosynthesis monooxygenase [Halalkalibacter hemicellulosilyticus]|uniref:Antibiotic biosynthesis monooxygenase domain-containing protein n=1 Tax=Halalkalibacter hemicellulosilyticusJCM 9152 TaxID=1236971 RepID=W4QEP1_9BACI|nr:antibiotic biosynthesis monooxygenase [Halalkalibacter hemicellulosilyticus]GAE29819.1 antibiotic biosynthesis monooxygenase domain-containing protein [Halalkalibacter hemicellulosilyticusJCM 9152]